VWGGDPDQITYKKMIEEKIPRKIGGKKSLMKGVTYRKGEMIPGHFG